MDIFGDHYSVNHSPPPDVLSLPGTYQIVDTRGDYLFIFCLSPRQTLCSSRQGPLVLCSKGTSRAWHIAWCMWCMPGTYLGNDRN